MRLKILLLFLLLQSTLLTAQTLVYPVRSGHKWGYVNSRGKWMIKPRYEAFSESDLPMRVDVVEAVDLPAAWDIRAWPL